MSVKSKIATEEILKVSEEDTTRAVLMILANEEGKKVEKMKYDNHRFPEFHEAGWYLALETPNGIVGMWSCWLKDKFYLGYPEEIEVSDELVLKMLEMNGHQSAHKFHANFCGEELADGRRVWVRHSNFDSYAHRYPYIEGKQLKKTMYGHNRSKGVATLPMWFGKEDDAPTDNSEAIQPYRDRFIKLALTIAEQMGGVTAVNVQYDFTVLVPEQLEFFGYRDVSCIKGNFAKVSGFGGTQIYGKLPNGEEIILESGNSLVPWGATRRIPVSKTPTVEEIHQFLTF